MAWFDSGGRLRGVGMSVVFWGLFFAVVRCGVVLVWAGVLVLEVVWGISVQFFPPSC